MDIFDEEDTEEFDVEGYINRFNLRPAGQMVMSNRRCGYNF